MEKRILVILIMFILFFLGITGKAFYEQVIMGPTYASKSFEIRTQQFPAEEFKRGDILDRNGISLTNTTYQDALIIFPKLVKNPEQLVKNIANKLDIEINLEDLEPYYRGTIKIYPEPIVIYLDENSEIITLIESWQEPGIVVAPIKKRYGENSLAVHLVGYLNYEQRGIKGLEARFDGYLQGSRAERIVTPITDARNNVLEGLGYRIIELEPDPNRHDLFLTIDSRVQKIVEEAMDTRGILKGGIVVLDINTGSILAAASRPTFDQNNPTDTKGYEDNQLERVIDYKVYPGSIFKVITAAAALEEGIVTPNTKFVCTGSSPYITCPREHGELTFSEAMERSCNTTLVEVGLKLGREKLEEYMIDRFGFTPEENKFLDSAKARANGIIGQEIFKVSPLEMANMMATIARDGYHQKIIDPWQTRLVKEVRGRQSTITFSEIPEFQKIYNQKTAQALKDILKATNQKGSGQNAWVEGFGSAGKTGTPQILQSNGKYGYMAWYTGYAPLEEPKLAIAVLIEEMANLNKKDLQGGRHAGPVFREIAEKTLRLLDTGS